MEFDFTIAIRKGRTHVLADQMSRIPNGGKPIGVDDNPPDAPLFLVDLVLEWVEEICYYLTNGLPLDTPLDMAKARRLIRVKLFPIRPVWIFFLCFTTFIFDTFLS